VANERRSRPSVRLESDSRLSHPDHNPRHCGRAAHRASFRHSSFAGHDTHSRVAESRDPNQHTSETHRVSRRSLNKINMAAVNV
jgi:hypothetical protein